MDQFFDTLPHGRKVSVSSDDIDPLPFNVSALRPSSLRIRICVSVSSFVQIKKSNGLHLLFGDSF